MSYANKRSEEGPIGFRVGFTFAVNRGERKKKYKVKNFLGLNINFGDSMEKSSYRHLFYFILSSLFLFSMGCGGSFKAPASGQDSSISSEGELSGGDSTPEASNVELIGSTSSECPHAPIGWSCNEVIIFNPLNSVQYKVRYSWNLRGAQNIASTTLWLSGSDGQWQDEETYNLNSTFSQLSQQNRIRSIIVDFIDLPQQGLPGSGGYFKGLDGYRKASKAYDLLVRHMIQVGVVQGSHLTHVGGSNGGTIVMFALAYHNAEEYLDQVILNAGPQPIHVEESCFNPDSAYDYDVIGRPLGVGIRRLVDLWQGWSKSPNEKYCERGVRPPDELLKQVSLLDPQAKRSFPHLTLQSIIGLNDQYREPYLRNHMLWYENTWAQHMTLTCVAGMGHELNIDQTYQMIVAGPQSQPLKTKENNCIKLPAPGSAKVLGNFAGLQLESGQVYLLGWTCLKNYSSSIDVRIFLNGRAATGEFLKNYPANLVSESGISAACGTIGIWHRFKIPLTRQELIQHAGKKLYIYGISPYGLGVSELGRSGELTVPALY